ncbi:DUF3152 domain-containing protein [Streptomyces sp. NBC_00568]|uniref:DUF3152 domain-containing protein n=1 Tax=Streptomyces sp. NBC_00568 TaxID=2975779 RepID=UPI00225B601A|nr:DUF3152 domain-containing protein [Streptomyces sp. NBC_00568]MCX4988613.1 DUF3152 domain-containing protein [Streptomyces sp. NBC_00568]
MGRHSRRGRAEKPDTSRTRAVPAAEAAPAPAPGPDRARRAAAQPTGPLGPYPPAGGSPQRSAPRFDKGTPAHGFPRMAEGTPARGVPRFEDGTPARGVPRLPDGTPAHGFPRMAEGTPARGVPRFTDGTPAQGVPRYDDGTPAHGVPRFFDGTPAHGMPRLPDGTPAHGMPRLPDGTPAHGMPRVRGGHPEQREPGGGWGESRAGGAPQGAPPGPRVPRQRQEHVAAPRQAYVDAFDLGAEESDAHFASGGVAPGRTANPRAADPYGSVTDWDTGSFETGEPSLPETEEQADGKARKGWAFTGIAAAAVTTVLAVVVAGQVASGQHDAGARTQAAEDGGGRATQDSASRGDDRPTQSGAPNVAAAPLTYDQQMARTYPLGAKLKASGKFDAVPGVAEAPGKGRKYTYRVDIEKGLGLDGELFAEAVQKTLNDQRSWAHGGARTFERIHSGKPDFVITLASPGTTAEWCAKSGLDTTEDNVSCDSASTERVMINAYRWAQGSTTYGDKIHAYRQMLINHEVGHRLGFGHVTCDKDGELAPVMQQQTKFLDHDGIHCLANPWAYPGS